MVAQTQVHSAFKSILAFEVCLRSTHSMPYPMYMDILEAPGQNGNSNFRENTEKSILSSVSEFRHLSFNYISNSSRITTLSVRGFDRLVIPTNKKNSVRKR